VAAAAVELLLLDTALAAAVQVDCARERQR
jgi:hypothetical protein